MVCAGASHWLRPGRAGKFVPPTRVRRLLLLFLLLLLPHLLRCIAKFREGLARHPQGALADLLADFDGLLPAGLDGVKRPRPHAQLRTAARAELSPGLQFHSAFLALHSVTFKVRDL